MFPTKSNDPYINKNGTRSTLGNKIGSGGSGGSDLPDYSVADAGKVLTVGDDGELEWNEAGGAGGVYVGTTPPASTLGSNGDYYYLRENFQKWLKDISTDASSTQTSYGVELKMNKPCKILGISAMSTATKSGSLVIGDSTEILETISNVEFEADTWITEMLTTPIDVNTDDTIIIKMNLSSAGGISYTQSSTSTSYDYYNDVASYVHGRYGQSYPGASDNAKIPISIIIESPYYYVQDQYIKDNNVWVLL